MSRRHNGNNAFALANGSRLAADSTHGVTCTFTGGCRVFDANINKKHENYWRCEHHGGVNNHARANAKDEDCRDGIPGEARRQRIARFRNKQRKPKTAQQYSKAQIAHAIRNVDQDTVKRILDNLCDSHTCIRPQSNHRVGSQRHGNYADGRDI